MKAGFIAIRIDGVPYTEGRFSIRHMRAVSGATDAKMTQLADWVSNRQHVRESVIESEKTGRGMLPHYPESLSLELTPRCNLHCPHCSSHGKPELQKYHNSRPEMSLEQFDSIAHELFPHITALSLVGRGEPTLASDPLWEKCKELIKHYGVKLTCVTNGHFIKRRFTEDLFPYIDEICVSIDGNSAEVHRQNRGGSSLEKVLDNISYFHDTRQKAKLARRPKLSFYWTLMANNIHELPEFIRYSERFDPDYFAIRHLVVFHDKDRALSLMGQPEKVNPYLMEAYAELESRQIQFEGPPLMDVARNVDVIPTNIIARESSGEERSQCDALQALDSDYLAEPCTWMHRTGIISHNGEVTTCGKHYGELVGRLQEDTCFNDVWNGAAMQSLRTSFNTPKMWRQCKECWLRELRWHSQRRARDSGVQIELGESNFTNAAWDYRAYSKL
ncbi:MAG: radical SAM protein [Hahellaceae bacterium]|nr:radical SAM protein [Hahellaceae bacterium]MCP5211310.1 radical SAM protein [Hahellaceae bacterium]